MDEKWRREIADFEEKIQPRLFQEMKNSLRKHIVINSFTIDYDDPSCNFSDFFKQNAKQLANRFDWIRSDFASQPGYDAHKNATRWSTAISDSCNNLQKDGTETNNTLQRLSKKYSGADGEAYAYKFVPESPNYHETTFTITINNENQPNPNVNVQNRTNPHHGNTNGGREAAGRKNGGNPGQEKDGCPLAFEFAQMRICAKCGLRKKK